VPSNLKVQYYERSLSRSTPAWISPDILIKNMGTTPVLLSDLVVKYWYTIDNGAVSEQDACDFTTVTGGSANVIFNGPTPAPFTTLSPARTNADTVYTFGFAGAAGNLAANGQVELQLRFARNDFKNFTQTNDYSHISGTTLGTFVDNPHITMYRAGTLVWGSEPQ
jgi:hypothetical protein